MTILRYGRPSTGWLDRLPLGNGRIGAMVGVDGAGVRIGLNESTAWSGGIGSARRDLVAPGRASEALAAARDLLGRGDPVGAEEALRPLQHHYAQAYLPVGELEILLGLDEPSVTRTLDLDTAVHHATLASSTGSWMATTATAWADDVLVHRMRGNRPADLSIALTTSLRRVSLTTTPDGVAMQLALPADVAPGHEPDEPACTWDRPGVAPAQVLLHLRVVTDGAVTGDPDGRITITGARAVDVALAIETTFRSPTLDPGPAGPAAERAAARAQADVGEAFDRHRARYAALAGDFSLRLGAGSARESLDPDRRLREVADVAREDPGLLALLAEYSRYLLVASSRPGGLPATLQGIWNAEMQPPWSSAYTLNINLQMNYWGAESTGASGAHEALLTLLEGLADRGRDTARRLYATRGWVAHHNSDAWAYSLPTGGDASWAHWPMGGAWLVLQFDEHRRFGAMTRETLDRFWPVVRGAAQFLIDWIGDDGSTSPSTSPENRFLHAGVPASVATSSAMDRAIAGDCLRLASELAARLAPGDPVGAEAAAAAARIAPPRVAADGRIEEWGSPRVDEDPRHRHLSHLYPWFPGTVVPTEPLGAAVARTLDTRGDDSTGWSLAWKIALRARLGDAAAVGRLLNLVTRPADDGFGQRGGLYPNLFAAHPPFQIDGNLGFLGAFVETLVQSHRPGRIDLLPALAPGLDSGEVTGIVARPGVLVHLAWEGRRPTLVRLRPRTPAAAGRYRVTHGGAEQLVDLTDGQWSEVRFA